MSKSTCSTPECDKPAERREWCNAHYRRLLKAGALQPRTGTCQECGDKFTASVTGPARGLCDECKPSSRTTCLGCGVEIGLTPRVGWHGMAPARKYCSDDCKPRCAVSGCKKPKRKLEWCSNHYSVWLDSGDPETKPSYKWSDVRRCLTCGNSGEFPWALDSRKFCTQNCKVTWRYHGGLVPESYKCAVCSIEIAFFDPVTRRRQRSDTKFCAPHAKSHRAKISADQIALEDGPLCRVCGKEVDMRRGAPFNMNPSVDHIIPRSLGGGDERANLQLAHRGCNSSKGNRYIG